MLGLETIWPRILAGELPGVWPQCTPGDRRHLCHPTNEATVSPGFLTSMHDALFYVVRSTLF